MIKTRIIAVVLVKDGIAVQSIGFKKYLPIGSPLIAIKFLDSWGVDEIVVLHMDGNNPTTAEVNAYAKNCNVPLSIGGGINDIDKVKAIIHSGADKVIINSALITKPHIVTETATMFGSQSIIASIDAYLSDDGKYSAKYNSGYKYSNYTALDLAQHAQELGAGEILLNSINNDGSKNGYDLALLKLALDKLDIPVIICGGVGHPKHMFEAINLGVSGVAAANFFHFSEHSVITVKKYLTNQIENKIRLDSYANYEGFNFFPNGRINKLVDNELESLRFHYIPEEKI